MNIIKKEIKCIHSEHEYSNYFTIPFSKNNELLSNAISEGAQLALKVNPHDPGGHWRSPELIRKKCIYGMLAENTVRHILKNEIEKRNIDAEVLPSKQITDGPKAGSQIDIPIKIDNIVYDIEVRSSFPYANLYDVITRHFDIIGWYRTFTKPGEHAKDYYLRVLFNFDQKHALDKLESGFELHFVGGATKQMLEQSSTWDDFEQPGAEYTTIKPICKALDAEKILDNIFSHGNFFG
jgi:hypothetical protein